MFVILYQGTEERIQVKKTQDGYQTEGKWLVDTDENGGVATIEDLTTALARVTDIRKKGGEACLAVIIE